MRKAIIGVMGPGEGARKEDIDTAYHLGELIAEQGWVLLSGGRKSGVMDAVNKGAKSKNGLTLGILPTDEADKISEAVDLAVITNMRSGRNYLNILSSHVVIACGMNHGTASEVALALVSKKPVILLNSTEESKAFFKSIGEVNIVQSAEEAIVASKKILG